MRIQKVIKLSPDEFIGMINEKGNVEIQSIREIEIDEIGMSGSGPSLKINWLYSLLINRANLYILKGTQLEVKGRIIDMPGFEEYNKIDEERNK